MSRHRFVSTMKAEGFPVLAACEVAEVSISSYYEWLHRSSVPSEGEWDEANLVNEMHDIHRQPDDTYGGPRMTGELRRRGYCVDHKQVERLMAENGIVAADARRKKLGTTIPHLTAPPLPDLVGRDFSVGQPGRRTCGDITYVPTSEGWLYLADVLDLGSRRVVGYAMSEHMPTELVACALKMAIETRGGNVAGMIFHHDRGSQYISKDFRGLCRRHRVAQSVGPIGLSADNAVAKSFWSSLKRELVHRYRFATRVEAMAAITAWIRRRKAVRLHSSLGNVPPLEWELRYGQTAFRTAQAA